MLKRILVCFLVSLVPGVAAAACGSVPSSYPVLSGSQLEVGKDSTVNNGTSISNINGGAKYDGALNAINPNTGAVISASSSFPSLDPATFPGTGSTDTSAATVAAGSYDDVTVANSSSTTFSGGSYYIDKLDIGKSATVNLAAGSYFIKTLSLGDGSRIVVSPSGPVRLYIDSKASMDKNTLINAAGTVADLQVFLYPGADWDAANNVTLVGIVYAPGTSSKIEFGKDSSIRGALVTAGEVNLDKDAELVFSAADQAAVGGVNTCAASAAPGGFNAFETSTAAGATTGVIRTKIAASAFSLAVVALKSSGTAVETAFSGDVKLELVDASAGVGCGAYALIRNLGALTFAAADMGRKTLAGISEPNAWPNARIRMTYPATGVPTITACSTDNFAIRPASLANVSVTDNDWQSPGINRTLANMTASGGYVHKAGQQFTLRATGFNASDSPTGNYTGSPTLKTLACTLPTAPSTCINGILTPGVWSGSGTVTSSSASYSETGSFNLTLEDQTFANVDSADSTLLERTIPQATAVLVGRFVPDHFELTAATTNTPVFKTFNDTACATRSFTYVGQPFGYVVRPTATILAKDKDNNTLANYKGSLWKIGDLTGITTPVVTKNCLTSPDLNTCVFTTFWDAASGSSVVTETYTYALTPASTPNWDDSGSTATAAGVDKNTGLISFIASDTLAFKRSNTTPQALFTASITNVIAVKDMSEDGNCGMANCDITTTTPAEFSNIGFDSGNEFRFGRLVLSNAHGSELLDLPVPIEAQFWNGSGFTRNTADHCTQLAAANVSRSNWQRDLNACKTSASLSGRFNAGRGNLKLSKPGAGNTGSVDLTLQLGVTANGSDTTCVGGVTVPTAPVAASQSWLQGRWTGGAYDQNPAARASFGLYRGSKSLIYLREMY